MPSGIDRQRKADILWSVFYEESNKKKSQTPRNRLVWWLPWLGGEGNRVGKRVQTLSSYRMSKV